MRLAFVCNEYPPAPYGGIGTFVKNLARDLTSLGQEVFVIGYDPSAMRTRWESDCGVKVLRIARSQYRWPAVRVGRYCLGPGILLERYILSQMLRRVCSDERVDLVESYDWSGPLWFKPRHVPLVVRLHGANTAYAHYEGLPGSRLLRYLERRNVLLGDALVAVSRHIGIVTLEALGLRGGDFRVVYNAVDTRLFQPRDVERNEYEVLYVGRVHRRKGLGELMEAWPLVVSRVPKAHLTVAGRIPGGKEGQDLLRDLLRPIPEALRGTVSLAGFVPHERLPLWYSRAAVSVFPSRAEAFGLTCAEAMACGAGVIMTTKGSGPELVEDGVSGLLVDPTKIEGLAGAIVRLLENPSLRRKLGNNARRRVEQLFDSRVLAEKNLKLYAEVLGYASVF